MNGDSHTHIAFAEVRKGISEQRLAIGHIDLLGFNTLSLNETQKISFATTTTFSFPCNFFCSVAGK